MGKKINELTEINEVPSSSYILVDDGTLNNKVTKENLMKDYLPLTGGTVSGPVLFNDNIDFDGRLLFANNSEIKWLDPDNNVTTLMYKDERNIFNIGDNGTTEHHGNLSLSTTKEDKVLLTLNTDRPWTFSQGNTGIQATLDLMPTTDNKSFRIVNTAGTHATYFTAGTNGVNLNIDGKLITSDEVTIGGSLKIGHQLHGTKLNTGNTQLIGTDADSMYFGNVKSRVYIESTVTPLVRIGDGTTYSIYHTGNKPTPADIGALPLTGGTLTGNLVFSKIGGGALNASIANSTLEANTGNGQMMNVGYDNTIFVGNPNTHLTLESNGNPIVNVGSNAYQLYHTGNKPTPADIGAAPSSHNHTSLTGITNLEFAAYADDSASISTTVSGENTYLDFNITDDANKDGFRWKASLWDPASGNHLDYNVMTLIPGFASATPTQLSLEGNISCKTLTQTSDAKYKEDIRDIDDNIFFELVKNSGVHSYILKYEKMPNELKQEDADQNLLHVGIIAQEMAQYEGSKYILNIEENEDGETEYSVGTYNLTSAVMAALKVEISKREAAEARIADLEEKVNMLMSLLEK